MYTMERWDLDTPVAPAQPNHEDRRPSNKQVGEHVKSVNVIGVN